MKAIAAQPWLMRLRCRAIARERARTRTAKPASHTVLRHAQPEFSEIPRWPRTPTL